MLKLRFHFPLVSCRRAQICTIPFFFRRVIVQILIAVRDEFKIKRFNLCTYRRKTVCSRWCYAHDLSVKPSMNLMIDKFISVPITQSSIVRNLVSMRKCELRCHSPFCSYHICIFVVYSLLLGGSKARGREPLPVWFQMMRCVPEYIDNVCVYVRLSFVGREGNAVTLVTQFDVKLVHAVEQHISECRLPSRYHRCSDVRYYALFFVP